MLMRSEPRESSATHPRFTRALQFAIALAGLLALEALFFVLCRLGNLAAHVVETIGVGLAAGLVYLLVLFGLERAPQRRATLWLILTGAILFRLTLLPLVPTLSDDFYRYRWDARIQQAGWNPYSVRPDDIPLKPLALPPGHLIPGHDIPSIYPPLSELVFRAAYRFLPGPIAFKLPFFAADLFTVFLLAAWLRSEEKRNFRLAIYAWNPLVVVEFAASGHSDALAVLAVVAALMIIKRRPAVSMLLLAAGALLKIFPVTLFPLWLREAGWPRKLASWGSGVAAAALAVICAWPYRSALPHFRSTMAYFESRWQNNNASFYSVLEWFSHSRDLAAGVGMGVVIGLALWTAARRIEPVRAAYLIFGAILILSPNAYSWYFTWIVPLLCFFPNPAWLLLTVLQFLSYHVLIDYQALGTWHWSPAMLWLTYGPFYALLLWQRFRRHQQFECV